MTLVLLAGCDAAPDDEGAPDVPGVVASPSAAVPALQVTTVRDGLDHPWDLAPAPDGDDRLLRVRPAG